MRKTAPVPRQACVQTAVSSPKRSRPPKGAAPEKSVRKTIAGFKRARREARKRQRTFSQYDLKCDRKIATNYFVTNRPKNRQTWRYLQRAAVCCAFVGALTLVLWRKNK